MQAAFSAVDCLGFDSCGNPSMRFPRTCLASRGTYPRMPDEIRGGKSDASSVASNYGMYVETGGLTVWLENLGQHPDRWCGYGWSDCCFYLSVHCGCVRSMRFVICMQISQTCRCTTYILLLGDMLISTSGWIRGVGIGDHPSLPP